jgi:hypothetical protein
MFERDAAALPVRVRPSGGREFGSAQWPNMQFGALPMQLADHVERNYSPAGRYRLLTLEGSKSGRFTVGPG